MTTKQKWLLERLLIPAGIIPPLVKVTDLVYSEKLRHKIGNIGFEYFYILEQSPDELNQSAIGGKIFAVHAPWQGFPPIEHLPAPLRQIMSRLVLGNKKFPNDHLLKLKKSLAFAKKIGAKVVTTHIIFFNHRRLPEELAQIAGLEEKFQISIAIEHEANYLPLYQKWGYSYKKINGDLEWMTNPLKLRDAVRKLYPRKSFHFCLDTGALQNFNLPIVPTARAMYQDIVHYHLADNPVGGDDLALEIKNPAITSLVNFLYEKKYAGYITVEVSATNGRTQEELLAKIYAASSLVGLPIFKKESIKNAQTHIQNSCQFLLRNI